LEKATQYGRARVCKVATKLSKLRGGGYCGKVFTKQRREAEWEVWDKFEGRRRVKRGGHGEK